MNLQSFVLFLIWPYFNRFVISSRIMHAVHQIQELAALIFHIENINTISGTLTNNFIVF